MELELAFFGAQPEIEQVVVPRVAPALLAVDFDQTLVCLELSVYNSTVLLLLLVI
jgi:hypothetical protein